MATPTAEQLALLTEGFEALLSVLKPVNDQVNKLNNKYEAEKNHLQKLIDMGHALDSSKVKDAANALAEVSDEFLELKKRAEAAGGATPKLIQLMNLYKDTKGIQAQINSLQELGKAQKENAKTQVDLYKTQGKLIQAKAKEMWEDIKDNFKSESGGSSWQTKVQGTAKATAGAIGIAQDPSKMLDMMGPWGIILKLIIDVVDAVRKLRGELMQASSAGGRFADGLAKATAEANLLASSQAEFATMGLDVEEVKNAYVSLKKTGIESLESISGGLVQSSIDVIAFSKATGESADAVTGRMAKFIRNFGMAKEDITKKYYSVLQTANKVAQQGIMTTEQYMATIDSLGDSFKDAGINIMDVNKILSTVSRTMANMGRPLENIQKVAQGILGITKASEGWKVFMAKMSGVQGGYAESLFAAQQRGPGFNLAKKGEFDAQKMIEMAQAAILKPTAGIADAATRQYMIEKMGSQFGMDEETTRVFQQLGAGAISQEEAAGSLNQLREAALKNSMDAKGMFDIIKNILMGMIAKPIIAIWSWLAGGKEAAKWKAAVDKAAPAPHFSGGEAIPRITESAGMAMMRVDPKEALVGGKVYPMARTKPLTGAPFSFNDGGRGGGPLSANLTINVMLDGKQLQRYTEKQTVGLIRQQQKANGLPA